MLFAGCVKLQGTRSQPLFAITCAFLVFAFQNKTDLARSVHMLSKSKPGRDDRFGKANTVQLADAKFLAKAVGSFCLAHPVLSG